MMKRLQKEISRLEQQLQIEKSKNSEIQVHQIKNQIMLRQSQFLHSQSISVTQIEDKNRRRTWCPSSTSTDETAKSCIPQPSKKQSSNYLMPPPPPFVMSGDIRSRKTTLPVTEYYESIDDEEFVPGEDCVLERTLSPAGSELNLNMIQTPKSLCGRLSVESPDIRRFNSPTQWKAR